LALRAGIEVPVAGVPAPPALAAEASERALENKLHTLCTTLGYLRYHTYRSTRSAPGFPDDIILDPANPQVLYALECKRVGAQPSPVQRRWLDALAQVERVHAGVYTPAEWPELQQLLTRRAP
jgi:hypothetical protein